MFIALEVINIKDMRPEWRCRLMGRFLVHHDTSTFANHSVDALERHPKLCYSLDDVVGDKGVCHISVYMPCW